MTSVLARVASRILFGAALPGQMGVGWGVGHRWRRPLGVGGSVLGTGGLELPQVQITYLLKIAMLDDDFFDSLSDSEAIGCFCKFVKVALEIYYSLK